MGLKQLKFIKKHYFFAILASLRDTETDTFYEIRSISGNPYCKVISVPLNIYSCIRGITLKHFARHSNRYLL